MTKTIPVLNWTDDGEPFVREARYEGPVPREVAAWLNSRIIGCSRTGFLYPCDPRDCYDTVFLSIEKSAARLQTMKLEKADPITYLIAAVNRTIIKYHARIVQRYRMEYRTVERSLVAAEIASNAKEQKDAPEGADVGYAASAAATEACNSEVELGGKNPEFAAQPLTAQQLSEVLSASPSAHERREEARIELEAIFARLPDEVVRAFTAWIAADGNMFQAAHLAHIGKNRYYKNWKRWLAMARRVALTNH